MIGGALLAACTWSATSTVLTLSSPSVGTGQSVTLGVTVAVTSGGAAPTGQVEFLDGSAVLGTVALSSGGAQLSISTLAVGTHQLSAEYLGSFSDAPSTSPAATKDVAATAKYYLALRDSLAAGYAVGPGQGYVALVGSYESQRVAGLTTENLGCSGATSTSLINGGGCTYAEGSQLAAAEYFLQTHPGQVAFITIDIGANDIDGCTSTSGTVNMTCVSDGEAAVEANVATILSGLEVAGPGVPIFAMTYYDPFLAAWITGNQTLATDSEQLLVGFNDVLQGDISDAGSTTVDVQDAFQSTDFSLTGSYNGTTLPQNVADICSWTFMCTSANIHANVTGYQVIATAFEHQIDLVVP